jgi:hypothetical protein
MGRGQLVFKGEKKKKKKFKHSLKDDDDDQVVSSVAVASVPVIEKPVAATASSSATTTNEQETPQIRKGTGQITTSGTVVTGYETLFEKQMTIGDAVLVQVGGQQEMRVVTMRLSNISLNLSSAFSTDLKSPTDFHYIGKPRDKQKERELAAKKAKLSQSELEAQAFGTYASQDLVYREKTETGSYRIKREKASADSRGDLLHLRAKKTSDKYC